MDGTSLKRAFKLPTNYNPIIFCTISLVAIGVVIIMTGAIIILVDHIELGPPHYDQEYERYVGSSLAQILGE